jgi:hypothetical protein
VDVDVVAGGEVAGDVVAEVFGGGDGEGFGAGEAAVGAASSSGGMPRPESMMARV